MPSLTHVCMWSKDGWERISAQQAAKIHPGGTVSAHSGLFMCELCGQYVLLTDEGYQIRHFRHSSHEKSKNCPERTSGIPVYNTYSSKEHDLPIRISNISSSSFIFELGLIRVPEELLKDNIKIEIKPYGINNRQYVYSKERLNYSGISYVSIGDIPYQRYSINVINGKNEIYDYWSKDVIGIDISGTLFEASTGKMLPYDSDVEIGKEYYLLCRKNIYSGYEREDITIEKVTTKTSVFSFYYLYSIVANSMNEFAARFFLDFHYRLTDKPIVIQPIWPPYIENSYLIKHYQDYMYLHVKGNTSPLKTFPQTSAVLLNPNSKSKLYNVNCQQRQQLISTGRVNALKYTYLWKEAISENGRIPAFSITDMDGNSIEPGESSKLPKDGVIRVKCEFDGEIVIKQNNFIVDKQKIQADKLIELDEVSINREILLYIGFDCVWKLSFIHKLQNQYKSGSVYLNRIVNLKGNIIKPPHSLKNIAIFYQSNRLLYEWILNCIKKDRITDKALKILEGEYLKRNLK